MFFVTPHSFTKGSHFVALDWLRETKTWSKLPCSQLSPRGICSPIYTGLFTFYGPFQYIFSFPSNGPKSKKILFFQRLQSFANTVQPHWTQIWHLVYVYYIQGGFFDWSALISVLKRKTLFNQWGYFVDREFLGTESLIGCPSFFILVLKIGRTGKKKHPVSQVQEQFIDQFSSSESRPSINFKISTKHQHPE